MAIWRMPIGATRSRGSWGKNGASQGRSRLRILLAILMAANAVLLVLFFRPPSRTLAQQEAELQRISARHATLLATVQRMRDLSSQLQEAIQTGRQFPQEHFLQPEGAFSAMLEDLQEVATQNSLTPASINYQREEHASRPGWVSIKVRLSVDGQYADLVRFINSLEQSPLFWILNNLKVSGSAARGLRLDLEMETYIVPS